MVQEAPHNTANKEIAHADIPLPAKHFCIQLVQPIVLN